MAGRHVEEVARLHDALGAVVHLHGGTAAHHEADVLDLAGRLASCRADMLGPAPAGFIRGATDRHRTHVEDLELALLEGADLRGLVEVDEG
jgi:hypothetical protein